MNGLNALLDNPVLLLIVLAAGAVIGIAVERFAEGLNKAQRKAYWQGRKHKGGEVVGLRPSSAAQAAEEPSRTELASRQLKQVMEARFKPRALFNKPERRLFASLDRILTEETPGWRAMGQVSLGEILYSENKDAFLAINSKRVDLLIVDADCRPLHAVEFHGTGHHKGLEAAARDAVKKEALRRAGIGYVEVVSGDTQGDLRNRVRALVRSATTAAAEPETWPGFGRKTATPR